MQFKIQNAENSQAFNIFSTTKIGVGGSLQITYSQFFYLFNSALRSTILFFIPLTLHLFYYNPPSDRDNIQILCFRFPDHTFLLLELAFFYMQRIHPLSYMAIQKLFSNSLLIHHMPN